LRFFLHLFYLYSPIFALWGEGGEGVKKQETEKTKKFKSTMLDPLPDLKYLYCLNYLFIVRNRCCLSCPSPGPWGMSARLPSHWSCPAPSTCASTLSLSCLLQLHHLDVADNSHSYLPPGTVSDAPYCHTTICPYYQCTVIPG
jgi:hypothetical protein